MNSPTPVPNTHVSTPLHAKAPVAFSRAVVIALAMWIYMVLALVALPLTSLYAHAVGIIASLGAGVFLEWQRSRGHKEYAAVFLLLLTIAPLLYRYQNG